MATHITLAAKPRDPKTSVRALRREQIVPGVMYGHGTEARSLQFEYLLLTRAVRRAGTSHLISLAVDGSDEAHDVLIREVQRDPITLRVIHVDFLAVVATEMIRSTIPLVQRGKSPVSEAGIIVAQLLEDVEVESLPRDIPESLVIDLTKLVDLDSRITVADLEVPEGVTVLTDPTASVAHLSLPRAMVEEVAPAAEAEAAAPTEAAPSEPTERPER